MYFRMPCVSPHHTSLILLHCTTGVGKYGVFYFVSFCFTQKLNSNVRCVSVVLLQMWIWQKAGGGIKGTSGIKERAGKEQRKYEVSDVTLLSNQEYKAETRSIYSDQ